MAQINEFFDESMGMTYIQPDGPNTAPQPFPCATIDGVDEPRGDVTRRLCLQADGTYRTVNRTQASPGSVTFDIVVWKAKQRNFLQQAKERRCPIPVYIHHVFCGKHDTFLNYEQSKLHKNAIVTNTTYNNMVRRQYDEGDTPEMVGMTATLSADPDSPEVYPLVSSIGDPASEDEPLRDIAACSIKQCVGPCGALVDRCDVMNITADAAGAAIADGYRTANNAATFAAWAAQPFIADEHVNSIVCFQINSTTTRMLVMRGATDAGNPAEVAYSDDNGATWTLANVGTTNGEFGEHSGSLFALDDRHIWACTDLANIYFSSDGGVTWTDQGAPTPGASEGLFYIHFIDPNYGWAVGGFRTTPTGLFLQTTDGGDHWNLAASEPTIERGNAVNVIDANHVWVGLDDGTVYFSNNWGTTWTIRNLPSTLTNLGDLTFMTEYEGALCGWKAGTGNGVPVIMRTWDGGFSWEEYNHTAEFTSAPTYMGLNSIIICGNINELHAVGDDVGGTSLVWTLKPEGW